MEALNSGNIALLIFFGAITLIIFIASLFGYLSRRSNDRVEIAHAEVRKVELEVSMRKSELDRAQAPKTL